MELSLYEREVLYNQHAILAKLDPENAKYHERAMEVFQNGYEGSYSTHMAADGRPVSEAVCLETMSILNMFRVLKAAYDRLDDKTEIDPSTIEFRGFDGNNDAHFDYCQFLKSEGKWPELDLSLNSHSEFTLSSYRSMYARWQASEDKYDLTRDDLIRIASC